MEQLQSNLKAISEFLAPINTTLDLQDSPSDWLENLLKEKLVIADSSKENEESKWAYVLHCLKLLSDLKISFADVANIEQADKSLPPLDTLSVGQQQNVSSMIQLVIALGIVPSLIPGVGIPVEKRSKFYEIVIKSSETQPASIEVAHSRLVISTKALIELSENPILSTVIFSKHLGDLLAALIQLSSAPLKKPSESDKEDSNGFVMTSEKFEAFVQEQELFHKELMKIVNKVYPPLIVKYLLVLQSCGAKQVLKPLPKSVNIKKTPTPKWLQNACGSLLTHILTSSKTGVLNVINGIVDVGAEDNSDNAQKAVIVAAVISNPPKTGKYADLENYYQLVSPQILSILESVDNSETKMFHLIACHCIKSLTERSLILSRRYLLNILLEPLSRLCEDQEENEKEVIVTEVDMENCIRRLTMCFVDLNDPSMIFITHLQPVIMVLLELHCRINFGVSHLKNSVEQLVQRFLRWTSKSLSMATIRAFALNSFDDSGKDERFKFKPMLDQYAFVAGEEGGIKAISKTFKKADEQSFYVADDEKAIILVDLLQSEKSDKTLGVEFFLVLLADLTQMMKEESEEDNLPKLEGNWNCEEQLLQLERDLDSTMNNLRRRLMVIRLLGLMSEDDKLQGEVMKNTSRLVTFLSLTFQRCASLCKLRQLKKEENDYTGGMTENQSLQTALGLLSHVVTQPSLQIEQWQSLQVCLDDLQTISELHEEEAIRKLSSKLKNLIDVNIQVIGHHTNIKEKASGIIEKTKEMDAKVNELKDLNKQALEESTETYQDVLGHLAETEIPIRGHGLIVLTNLVKKRDEEVMNHIEEVFNIFSDNLKDTDTYIYLQAIKGLATCSFHKPQIVIDKLCLEYAKLDDSKYPGEKGIERRTKIGEALVLVTRILGELTPAYKNKLLNPFLAQINHPDALVRSSSLSNLGEVCKNLRFALGDIVSEIFACLHQVVQFDKSIEVRRAGMFVFKLLLQGLGDDAFGVLQGALRDIYRTLIAQRNSEPDEIMQVHINDAIEEINKIVKKFMQPSNELKKTLYVLDKPPDYFQ